MRHRYGYQLSAADAEHARGDIARGGAAGGGVFCAVFRRQGDLSAHDADDDRRLQGLRRLSAHRNGLPHRQDAGLPRGGHDPGDGARDAAERPMDKLHRAASLSAWKKAPLPKGPGRIRVSFKTVQVQ